MNSMNKTARISGVLYLMLAITGGFSMLYIPSKLIVEQDAATTVNNIMANMMLFRIGIAANLISQTIFVFLVLSLYNLFKDVDKKQALLMVTLVVVAVPIAFLNMVNHLAVLVILNGTDFSTAFQPSQLQALVMLFLNLYSNGINVVQIFWGLWLIPFGVLVFKSGFIPKILGVLLIAGGIGYVITSFTFLLFPDYMSIIAPIATTPSGIAEFAIILWFLIKGVKDKSQ